MCLMDVCSISTATITLSSTVITSSQAVSISQQPQHQQDANVVSVQLRADDDERTDAKLMKCSTWQPGSLNGILPISSHMHESQRVHQLNSSPYHTTTTGPLRLQTAGRNMPLGSCPGSWQPQFGSSYERNGLLPSANNDRMDTSDDMPLNLSTGVRSSRHETTDIDNRRRIFTSSGQ